MKRLTGIIEWVKSSYNFTIKLQNWLRMYWIQATFLKAEYLRNTFERIENLDCEQMTAFGNFSTNKAQIKDCYQHFKVGIHWKKSNF